MTPTTVKVRKPEAPCRPGDLVLWFDDEDGLWYFGTASQVDARGSVQSIETPTGEIVPRAVGSVVHVVQDNQLTEGASVVSGALYRFGFLELSSARVALLPYLDLSRDGTRKDLTFCGVVVRVNP